MVHFVKRNWYGVVPTNWIKCDAVADILVAFHPKKHIAKGKVACKWAKERRPLDLSNYEPLQIEALYITGTSITLLHCV